MTNTAPTTHTTRTWSFYETTLRAAIYALTDYAEDLLSGEAETPSNLARMQATELAEDLKVLRRRLTFRTKGTRHEMALTHAEADVLFNALLHRNRSLGCESSFEAACDVQAY